MIYPGGTYRGCACTEAPLCLEDGALGHARPDVRSLERGLYSASQDQGPTRLEAISFVLGRK